MLYAVLGIAYFMYAFTQASVQVKLGHTFAEYTEPTPAVDLFGFMVFAPLVTGYYFLYLPYKLFEAYANRLARK